MNISSVIIKTKDLSKCKDELSKINGVEVALYEDSTIIATIQANDINEEINIFKNIEKAKYVISASMHYSYIEDELRDDLANMKNDTDEILNDDTTPIDTMQYSGSVYAMINKKKSK